ncbi:MAG TPA: UDP-glucose 4-epimerase GalE [Acidobacteriota bacterium]|nr:UDP-glucose 4-epimerase GalE [Acidobacteriota bacterium]
MEEIFVTGGAGYIGSHTLRALKIRGYDPVCFDNLSTGFREFAGTLPLIRGDLANCSDIERAFSSHRIRAVIHFASHALVEESCRNPYKYYYDNILNCLNLLSTMNRHGVRYFVFSSSCATYGIPAQVPIAETTPLNPVNPYGATKMMIERILADFGRAHGLRFVALRYFNAAGAHPDGTIGEWHVPESHLIPRLFNVALESGSTAEVYGKDYPTADGTCLRDYIHVTDLAAAHVSALEHLFRGRDSDIFNLGTGQGHSVLEVIRQAAAATGREIPMTFKPRRPGDPPALVADPARAGAVLEWIPGHSSLSEIVESAWNWHRARSARSVPESSPV